MENTPRTRRITINLSEEEYEWLRRKAHWDETSRAGLLRDALRAMIAHEGYLRPPDDEPQDFGFEKEQMQHVVRLQNETGSEN